MKRLLATLVTSVVVLTMVGPVGAQMNGDSRNQITSMPLQANLVGEADAHQGIDPDEHLARRLYSATLGREADAPGLDYWTDQLKATCSQHVAAALTAQEEFINRYADADTPEELLMELYQTAFKRPADPDGLAYWTSLNLSAPEYVLAFAQTAESAHFTGTVLLPANYDCPPSGWIDAGHGVYVPPVLLAIRYCESRDNYQAANKLSSARGAYQFLSSSWAAYGHARRYGVFEAHQATNAQQDEAAVITWQREGVRPWNSSRRCWE